ncbi:MAG: SIS domain-containing protein [Bacteriovoracaceae bacterium]|nr:SIS domain-containing protein [Bacteriovoracaceae bacterium]
MNEVQKIFEESHDPAKFSRLYFNYLSQLFSKINVDSIAAFIHLILECRKNEKNIFFIGNGGSAATASHFANDLQVGTRTTGKPFKVQSLTDNVAILSAIGNDFGYDYIFVKQLEALLNDGDVVVAISASGNSPNIVKAIEYTNKRNCISVGITGFDGGELLKLSKLNIHVPTMKGEYGPVEDVHMIFDHVIANYLLLYCKKFDGSENKWT